MVPDIRPEILAFAQELEDSFAHLEVNTKWSEFSRGHIQEMMVEAYNDLDDALDEFDTASYGAQLPDAMARIGAATLSIAMGCFMLKTQYVEGKPR